MRPLDDLRRALCVLRLDRIANVAELAVLEDEEAMTTGDAREAGAGAVGGTVVPVVDEVVVGFEDDDGGPDGVGEVEELAGG